MITTYHLSDDKGRCHEIPSTPVGRSILAFDGSKIVTISVDSMDHPTPIPSIVSSQLEQAVKAMEAAGVSRCYVVQRAGIDDIYCCWSQDRVLPATITRMVRLDI